jgi:hypothetical protein
MTEDNPSSAKIKSQEQTDEGFEEHREFVRDVDKRFSTLYGGCGALLLAGFFMSLIGFAYIWGWLTITPWVLAVTLVIVGLFVLRYMVHSYADFLYEEVEAYCSEHDISTRGLREAFDEQGRLQYFHSVFEVRERREELNR